MTAPSAVARASFPAGAYLAPGSGWFHAARPRTRRAPLVSRHSKSSVGSSVWDCHREVLPGSASRKARVGPRPLLSHPRGEHQDFRAATPALYARKFRLKDVGISPGVSIHHGAITKSLSVSPTTTRLYSDQPRRDCSVAIGCFLGTPSRNLLEWRSSAARAVSASFGQRPSSSGRHGRARSDRTGQDADRNSSGL